jgi:hypothetical protein
MFQVLMSCSFSVQAAVAAWVWVFDAVSGCCVVDVLGNESRGVSGAGVGAGLRAAGRARLPTRIATRNTTLAIDQT